MDFKITRTVTRFFLAVGVFGLMGVRAAPVASADPTDYSNPNNNDYRNADPNPPSSYKKVAPTPPAQPGPGVNPAVELALEIIRTRNQIVRDKNYLQAVTLKRWKEYTATPDWQNSQAAKKHAEDQFEAAKEPLVTLLEDNVDYNNLRTTESTCKDQLDAANAAQDKSTYDISQIASQMRSAHESAEKMITEAVRNDPTALEAKVKLQATINQQEKLKANFKANLPNDPEWTAAKQQLDSDRAHLEWLYNQSGQTMPEADKWEDIPNPTPSADLARQGNDEGGGGGAGASDNQGGGQPQNDQGGN
jgi:hypothetical protein